MKGGKGMNANKTRAVHVFKIVLLKLLSPDNHLNFGVFEQEKKRKKIQPGEKRLLFVSFISFISFFWPF